MAIVYSFGILVSSWVLNFKFFFLNISDIFYPLQANLPTAAAADYAGAAVRVSLIFKLHLNRLADAMEGNM